MHPLQPSRRGNRYPSGESSLTLQRALALLFAVADAENSTLGVSEIAATIGVSRAAVYRLLVPLSEYGFVWRDGTKIRLGFGFLRLSEKVLPQLRGIATPALRELAEMVGATAHLSVATGDDVQAIAVVEPSWTTFHVAYRVGSRHPIDVGAAGKALSLRGGKRWATSSGELESGASGVAAPIKGIPDLRASIGVISLEPLAADVVGPHVVATAENVAKTLHGNENPA